MTNCQSIIIIGLRITWLINGNEFTNSDNTLAVIHIVRDPRNVILSMANHFGITQEESYKIITDEKLTITKKLFNENYLKLSIGKKRHIKIEVD